MASPHGDTVVMPDYRGGSIVNLMASIVLALGGEESSYPPLRALPPAALTSRNVVLLVIDGLGHDCLTMRRPDGALARHLKDRITSVFPSTTASAVTTFLTGTAPQQHGIPGWFTYFREIGAILTVLPYRPRHGGSAPSVAAADLLDHVPIFDRLAARSHVVVPDRIAYSSFNVSHRGKARTHGFDGLSEMFRIVRDIVRVSTHRNYVYAYWPELDRLAHEHGIRSSEAAAHLARIDTAFERFLASIDATSTTVVVTADHGFIDARPDQAIDLEEHPELALELLMPLSGERRAAYCYVRSHRREPFAELVGRRFAQQVALFPSEHLLESGYFGLGVPHPRLHERIGDYTLIMKDAAVIKDWLPGEPRHSQTGVHGGMSAEEMHVPLIVAGA